MSDPTSGQESAGSPSSPANPGSPPEQPPSASGAGESAAKETGGPAPNGSAQNVSFNGTTEINGLNFDQRTIGTQVESQIVQLYQARSAIRRFACAEVEPVPPHWERDSAQVFRGEDSEVDALLKHLEERRVLVLAAQRGAGKVRAALYLGWHLRQRERCTGGTLLVEPLDRKVRVDVRHLAAHDRDLRNRLVIFPNAFSRADPEVTRLFEATDRSGWQALGEQLRARGAYLVFTTDPADAGALEGLAAHGVHRELTPHSPDLLAGELKRKLEQLAADGADPGVLAALREGNEWVAATFRYAPQVFDFVDHYVEMGVAGLPLPEAWRRMQNAGGRILQDLDGDFEGWSFAFTLALAECGSEAEGVAWVDADRLHRHVRQWLRRDLNLRYPDSHGADQDADADADTRLEFSDTRLLKRAHALVDEGAPSFTVRFRDGVTPEGMWKAMFERHRRALLTVLPGLRGLAERGDEELRTLRLLAARIVGRIGEMDAERIVLPVMDRWARSGNPNWQGSLGPLMDGVLAGGSERYRKACVHRLRQLRRTGPPGSDPDAHLPAVIAAWSWVGDHDLSAAMRELGVIVRERLVPVVEDMQELGRLLGKSAHAASEEQSARGVAVLISCHAALREVVWELYAGQGGAFLGVQASLASLCFTRGPVAVFTELRRWIVEDGWRAAAVLALMLLHERGIADQLKQSRGESGAAAAGAGAGCAPLASWLAESEAGVRQTASFLGDLFESLLEPFAASAQLQRFCVESLQAHLADWVRDALPVPEHAAAMRGLFKTLLGTHDGVLHDPLLALLEGPEFTGDDHAMRAFAASLRG
ncbi:MAG TPA: hypothetical protein VF710_15765 [Longimicrobium sp.]